MASTQASQDNLFPQSQSSMPTTPTPTHAQLPEGGLKPAQVEQPSLTPPPSSHSKRNIARTPTQESRLLSSPPPSTVRRARDKFEDPGSDVKITQEQIDTMPLDELRRNLAKLVSNVQDAKTAAAHYKLQHQMAQMESGEAVERMAVEMEMARREIEVLQQAETHRRMQEDKAAQPVPDPNFRQIHVDVYTAMMDDIRDLKIQNSQMERELVHARKVLEHQEGEIASLNDKVLLMRERIRESREQLLRQRRLGIDTTPRTSRTTPYQAPVRERFAHIEQSQSSQQHQQQQPGFAALLQATDIVSQGGRTPSTDHRKGHSRGTHSLSSLPATPQRSSQTSGGQPLYTPQPPRQIPIEVPMTAPVQRKRPARDMTPPQRVQKRGYESDGTVSAGDDSEAETEVAEGDVGDSTASQMASAMLRTPKAKRAKSAHHLKGMTQTRLFGQVTKGSVPRSEQAKGGREQDVGLGIAGVRDRQSQESPA
ncbi:hypothetical protein KVT40_005041 [Elsinoe batatas]|uniref:Uncharacterized protein n=1 Tax=Elsinoe batatas TaxID=2601811 RepID=A0A8K0L3K0_9PEZI|nr:hypothetical protein KVT40_005041 [Elsinoe batatas]